MSEEIESVNLDSINDYKSTKAFQDGKGQGLKRCLFKRIRLHGLFTNGTIEGKLGSCIFTVSTIFLCLAILVLIGCLKYADFVLLTSQKSNQDANELCEKLQLYSIDLVATPSAFFAHSLVRAHIPAAQISDQ